jgi:hypothetical protein
MRLHPEAVSEFRFIQPCNPISAKQVPAGDDWLHEPKLDGYRLQVAKNGPTARPRLGRAAKLELCGSLGLS